MVNFFVERGDDIEALDKWGKMPSEIARDKGFDMIALMLEILIRRKHLPPVPTHYLEDLYSSSGTDETMKGQKQEGKILFLQVQVFILY